MFLAQPAFKVWAHEYHNATTLHPVALALLVIMGAATLFVPRRHALLPIIAIACFVSPAQRVVVFSLDFTLLRVMVLFLWARLLLHNEARGLVWKPLDTVFLAFKVIGAIIFVARTGELINRAGLLFDAFGLYFAARYLIRHLEDFAYVVLDFIIVAVPVAMAFILERASGHNIFAVFGGVSEITLRPDGRLRAQGAFAQPILAGVFWATLMPLMGVLWFRRGGWRTAAVVGLAASMIVIICCQSSTPLMALMTGLLAVAMFPMRRYMRLFRWSLLFVIIGLHLAMTKPVWHLFARVSAVGGSTGYHRYNLINQAVEHFGQWWVWGTPDVGLWGNLTFDVTNQYIVEGIHAGVLNLGLFVAVITIAFRGMGWLWRTAEPRGDRLTVYTAWAMGAALIIHCMSFTSISYFGQIILVWYVFLGMMASAMPASRPSAQPVATRGVVGQRPAHPRRPGTPGRGPVRVDEPRRNPASYHARPQV